MRFIDGYGFLSMRGALSNVALSRIRARMAFASIVGARATMRARDGAAGDARDAEVSYVRYGTPRDDGGGGGGGDAGRVWNEPVKDARGRRRFHGAFSGGFSAGYFNTVGSAEGFTPSAFTSSRARGAGDGVGGDGTSSTSRARQSVVDFMDDDEREAYEAKTTRTAMEYDTFGHEARDAHRRSATHAMGRVGEAVSGALAASAAVLDLVAPRVLSVGARLLTKMGWRRGRGAVLAQGGALGKDEFGLEDAPAYVREPKTNRHGVGYDPFDGAEEFRDIAARRKRSRDDENAGLDRGRRRGEAFGLGVFEEEDEELYTEDAPKLSEYAFEMEDEEDVDARARARPGSVLALGAALPNDCAVRGFQVSSDTLSPPKWFAPPVIPRDWYPQRRAAAVRPGRDSAATAQPVLLPPEVPAPADAERQKVIDTLAVFVAKHGAQFEDMAKARQGDDKKFSFLFGGKDSGYYKWRLAKATLDNARESEAPPARRARPLGMEERAKILGEELLPSTTSAQREQNAAGEEPRKKLSIEGIAASDRERIQKLLTKTFTSAGVVQTAEVENVGLHVLQKSAPKSEPEKPSSAPTPCEASQMPIISTRNTIEWAPEPLLCKRFGVPDPYANRTRPDTSQYKFRTDVLELGDTRAKEEADAPKYMDVPPPPATTQTVPPPPPASSEVSAPVAETRSVPPPPPTFVEKPIDLFKQIFENPDDDIEEEEDLDLIQAALTAKVPQTPASAPAPPLLPPLLPPPPPPASTQPMWSSAVMKKPPSSATREERRSERESSKRRSSSKKEKKSKKDKRSKDRKDKKHSSSRHSKKKRSSRRDDYSSSSSSSYSD